MFYLTSAIKNSFSLKNYLSGSISYCSFLFGGKGVSFLFGGKGVILDPGQSRADQIFHSVLYRRAGSLVAFNYCTAG